VPFVQWFPQCVNGVDGHLKSQSHHKRLISPYIIMTWHPSVYNVQAQTQAEKFSTYADAIFEVS
jgi:hypothetical protein